MAKVTPKPINQETTPSEPLIEVPTLSATSSPRRRRGLIAALIVVLILVGAGAFLAYQKYQQAQLLAQNPSLAAKTENANLIATVGKLIELPTGEDPTIATVSDPDKLKSQPFFQNAQKNDRVLIYPAAKKAILYRPSANKIIEVAYVNLGAPQVAGAATSSAQVVNQEFKVAIFNGTNTAGLATTTETKLKSKFSNLTVVTKGNAKNNYDTTMIVDLTGQNSQEAQNLADFLSGKVSPLPAGEAKPAADLLIIAGKNLTP